MILRMWNDTKLAWFGKPSWIYLYAFILVSWNHTCGLELDIFFFGWNIFILPIVAHTNLTNVPQIMATIFISWRHFGIGLYSKILDKDRHLKTWRHYGKGLFHYAGAQWLWPTACWHLWWKPYWWVMTMINND